MAVWITACNRRDRSSSALDATTDRRFDVLKSDLQLVDLAGGAIADSVA